ncbi:hypothetical protein B0181_11430 [Moraxella caviae]|uniref:Uncharacterized protein n=1 Tax=Moraxella caviae TaxID=34060 RepID=A0A1S9ZTH1_9GAMM|nr:hypothetical protein [Moraxella caviae]OOR86819.1 hypothetical protein B0181_11430 [Moraxella caviae]STZ13607.1 Uncharacterised protein [Moraxella caviae]VEW13303.1 Uncharacterised protein [Moraxella caviae]
MLRNVAPFENVRVTKDGVHVSDIYRGIELIMQLPYDYYTSVHRWFDGEEWHTLDNHKDDEYIDEIQMHCDWIKGDILIMRLSYAAGEQFESYTVEQIDGKNVYTVNTGAKYIFSVEKQTYIPYEPKESAPVQEPELPLNAPQSNTNAAKNEAVLEGTELAKWYYAKGGKPTTCIVSILNFTGHFKYCRDVRLVLNISQSAEYFGHGVDSEAHYWKSFFICNQHGEILNFEQVKQMLIDQGIDV